MEKIEHRIINDLLKISQRLGERGWVPGSSGNISVIHPGKDQIYIKVTGKSMLDLTPSDILTLDLSGKVLEGEGRPSKEVRFHLGIYKAREDVKAVIHSHPPFASAFAIAGLPLPLQTAPGKLILKRVPEVEFALPGSRELAEGVVGAFKDPEVKAVLLKGHGIVAVGASLYDTYNITEWVEDAAREAFLVSNLTR